MNNKNNLTYKDAGVDISKTDALKVTMKDLLSTNDRRVLNKVGAFAALYDANFEIDDPVLVLKSEEPGSKQKLAFQYDRIESICYDMINHLVNDTIVMGAKPLAVLDTIVTSKTDETVIKRLVKGMRDACTSNECVLIGGETSIQPGIVNDNTCVLTSSIVGIASKNEIIDGSKIKEGDTIIGISSNGIHTNGYSLIRLLMEKYPDILNEKINGISFIEAIMEPHRPYYISLKESINNQLLTGMAHITGGGLKGNVCRIIPNDLCANIDLSKIEVLDLFKVIKKYSNASENEMLDTFNCGIGMVVVCRQENEQKVLANLNKYYKSYVIGQVIKNPNELVEFSNSLIW